MMQSNFDLWSDDVNANNHSIIVSSNSNKKAKTTTTKAKATTSAVSVDVAKAGQSYHPDPVAHAQILQKAAAIEIARETKKRERAAPLSKGMSAATRALLVLTDSEDDDSSDDDNDDANNKNDAPALVLLKRVTKLTKAQRNKKKRHRVEEAIVKEAKKQKQLGKQLNQASHFKKELNRQEHAQRQRAQLLQQQKDATKKQNIPGKNVEFKSTMDPEHAPLVAVALPREDDPVSSLRTLRPRGSLARDRAASWTDRQKAVAVAPLDAESRKRRAQRLRRRPKSVKGKHNAGTNGVGFDLLG